MPEPSLVREPAPEMTPARVSALVLVTVTDAPSVRALLRVRLFAPCAIEALLKVTALVPRA